MNARAVAVDTSAPLDCGHIATPGPTPGPSGYALTNDGQTLCYWCADRLHRDTMADPTTTRTTGYLGADVVTTWTGGVLARVTSARTVRCRGFNGARFDRVYLRAVAPDGSRWYGTSPGRGMFVRLRRAVTR